MTEEGEAHPTVVREQALERARREIALARCRSLAAAGQPQLTECDKRGQAHRRPRNDDERERGP